MALALGFRSGSFLLEPFPPGFCYRVVQLLERLVDIHIVGGMKGRAIYIRLGFDALGQPGLMNAKRFL